jgi:EmrB/QacA subfamily drug resistance transporter
MTAEATTPESAGAAEPQLADRSSWIALYVLCVGVLMIVLDVTVTNVALPTIQDDLGFTQSSLAWVVNGYLISFGGLLLLSGRLGDLLGRRRVFLVGIGIFTGASLLCGFSQSQEVLVGARFIQGIGGALASAVVLGMIVTMFPHPSEQARAIGVYGFVASAGGTIGLLAGGVLTEAISWHWIFFINVPIGIATALAARKLIPTEKGIGFGEGGADVPGAVLIVTSLMISVYTIVKPAAELGWTDPQTLALAGVSTALLIAFLLREGRISNPLIPLDIFKSRNISGANIVQALLVAGMFALFFMGALYMQEVLGYDALEVGLAFLPSTIVMGTMSLKFAEPLAMRFGPRNVLLVGMAFVGVGLLLWTRVPVDGNYWVDLFPSMIVLSLGIGACFPALMNLAMSGTTMENAGLASGLVNTSAQVGGALGLAVLATLSSTRTESLLEQGEATAEALVGGYHLAFAIGAALVGAALVIGFFVLEKTEPMQMHDMEPGGDGGGEGSDDEHASGRREPVYAEGV